MKVTFCAKRLRVLLVSSAAALAADGPAATGPLRVRVAAMSLAPQKFDLEGNADRSAAAEF